MRLPLSRLAFQCQPSHPAKMDKTTPRATKRPGKFEKPDHWSNDPLPQPQAAKGKDAEGELSPTRYGDWVKDGIAVDF